MGQNGRKLHLSVKSLRVGGGTLPRRFPFDGQEYLKGSPLLRSAADRNAAMMRPSTRIVPQSSRTSDSAGRCKVPMKIRSRQPSLRNNFVARPTCPTEIQ